ncbi:MAG: HAD-IIB family hydrolase [Bryobacterales bacterium]|nr:HAD-IIB family hydrolase [Bryobacterales bacterium]
MLIIFTDLDGTLLDRDTYSWQAALPALSQIRDRSIPLVFVTSKTRGEVEFWRRAIQNEHPFIVENGGAAFIPERYFPEPMPGVRRDAYHVLEWGTPYAQLIADLRDASVASRCPITAFHELAVEEVAKLCDLPLEQARLASQREYDEPFLVREESRVPALLAAIEARGRKWTKGGRFWHIVGANDKEVAVRALTALFERTYGPVVTAGLGDGLNDAAFLQATTTPIIIQSDAAEILSTRIPRALVTARPGPQGWNEAVLSMFRR